VGSTGEQWAVLGDHLLRGWAACAGRGYLIRSAEPDKGDRLLLVPVTAFCHTVAASVVSAHILYVATYENSVQDLDRMECSPCGLQLAALLMSATSNRLYQGPGCKQPKLKQLRRLSCVQCIDSIIG